MIMSPYLYPELFVKDELKNTLQSILPSITPEKSEAIHQGIINRMQAAGFKTNDLRNQTAIPQPKTSEPGPEVAQKVMEQYTPTESVSMQEIPQTQTSQFDWAGFMKLLSSPYATPAGIQYLLGTALKVHQAMMDEYQTKIREQQAKAIAENPIITRTMQLLPQMYQRYNELLKVIAEPTVPQNMKEVFATEAAKIRDTIDNIQGMILPQQATSSVAALPIEQQTAMILDMLRQKK